MREIIFDTETTGLSHSKGDRIIEIGAIELINRFPTGKIYHQYINSDGFPIHPDAERIHGISAEFLEDKPVFSAIADGFLAFFSDANLIAHNAQFDMGFVNAELKRIGKPDFPSDVVIDTLEIARRKHPMGPNSLDALCRRYGVDNSHRDKHGALLDSELLAEVYIELLGGKQASLELANVADNSRQQTITSTRQTGNAAVQRPTPLASRLTKVDIDSHQQFIQSFAKDPLWSQYD
ncbi:MAG: DNA polymerase III subunit epsilon [Hyphomicrobiales bacterium]|nr:DNA polymerase III subunit epsilon [Hyphomicrobiales bacterium]